jgi:hypothetical protein
MGNCYASCHADFEDTVQMVSNARGLTSEGVKKTLEDIRRANGQDAEYQKLRKRLPKEFPF